MRPFGSPGGAVGFTPLWHAATRPKTNDGLCWNELQRRNALTGNRVNLDSYRQEEPALYPLLNFGPQLRRVHPDRGRDLARLSPDRLDQQVSGSASGANPATIALGAEPVNMRGWTPALCHATGRS